MKIILASIIVFQFAINLSAFQQEATHSIQLLVDGKAIEHKGQLIEVFRAEGLQAQNSGLLPFLFLDCKQHDISRILELNDHSLRLATRWHLLKSASVAEDQSNGASSETILKERLAVQKKRFAATLEAELGCKLPDSVSGYFENCTLEGGHLRRWKLMETGSILKSEKKFPYKYPPDLPPSAGQPFVVSKSSADDVVIYNVRNSTRVVAQKYQGGKLVWSTELQHDWTNKSRIHDYEFATFRNETDQVAVITCTNRFAINFLSHDIDCLLEGIIQRPYSWKRRR